jgi:putative nucleotidyltransferase with HDIG domain
MLRRIDKADVRLGMYVHEIEGGWLDHPFWRTHFLVTDQSQLDELRDSDVRAVVIDTFRGKDVPDLSFATLKLLIEAERAAKPKPEPRGATRAPRAARAAPLTPPPRLEELPCSAGEELDRASAIIERSKGVVAQLLNQARLGKALRMAQAAPLVEEIAASVERNASALISVSRIRHVDEYTYVHSIAVCALMINLAGELGFDSAQVRIAGLAGLLHDFGKTGLPETILRKPAGLTDSEKTIVRTHSDAGFQALRESGDFPEEVLDACLHHHEKVDGSGYPHGLKGDEIGQMAQMVAVCDVYDAVTSNRPWNRAAGAADTISDMFGGSGHFNEKMLAHFVRSLGIYPVGSLVRLRSDRLGLVTDQCRTDLTRPKVRIFYCIKTRVRIQPYDVDLARERDGEAIVSRENPMRWGFTSWDTHWTDLIRRDLPRVDRVA